MELYILRHAIAEAGGSGPDADRALTKEGRSKLKRVLARAAKAGVSPSLILSSPYKRARQTAEVATGILHYRQEIVVSDVLVPESTPDALWAELRGRRHERSLLAVGHEPMLSTSAAWLLGAPGMKIELIKAAVLRMDFERFGQHPQGILRWMLTPRLAGGDSE